MESHIDYHLINMRFGLKSIVASFDVLRMILVLINSHFVNELGLLHIVQTALVLFIQSNLIRIVSY